MTESFLEAFDFNQETSLYIHVPFCTSKCSYCAFYSVPCANRNQQINAYVERILKEIDLVSSRMGGRPYTTAFIGGGNPGTLGAWNLGRIASAVCRNGRPGEFSTEMNPESLSEDYIPLFQDCFTRLSMGVQSMDPKALAFLGRNADGKQTRGGLELSQRIHSLTGCTLSYDLITCLGSWHDELEDVRRLTEDYPSDHLSVYALTLEEGTPLYKRRPDLPDSDQQFEILSRVWELLEGQGFEHYEVSNFAKNGRRCEHNCRYWAYRQYVGLGPGAASTAFDKDGRVTRFSFMASVEGYAAGFPLEDFESEHLSRTEALEELVLMGLRYKGGLDIKRVERLCGGDSGLREIALEGYHVEGDFLVPDDSGLMTADSAARSVLDCIAGHVGYIDSKNSVMVNS